MLTLWLFAMLVSTVLADTPANCTINDIAGKWTLYEGSRTYNSSIDCSSDVDVVRKLRVNLKYPAVAVDEFGNLGHWTMTYNEGFQVTVNQRIFFAFSYYKKESSTITSYCDKTFQSWSHDVTLRNWACFYARKQSAFPPKVHRDPFHSVTEDNDILTLDEMQQLVDSINRAQTSWRAEVHLPFVGKTRQEMVTISGGRRSWLAHRVAPSTPTAEIRAAARALPRNFDWRNINGNNYVSPVRNQDGCGSCYAFSSTGMLEARLRVQTNNTLQVQLSPQDIVSCSQLSQGCDGGFPFLVAGKYAKEFGAVEESCNPYVGQGGACTRSTCHKHYTASYGYVGGYYGACNEGLMRLHLVQGGPISVSFEVYEDFRNYKSGIYHHTGLGEFRPFETVNHAVLLVGYGVNDTTGEKYWIVKNSWGEGWGENGFFKIRRGTDEVGIESIAVYAVPIP